MFGEDSRRAVRDVDAVHRGYVRVPGGVSMPGIRKRLLAAQEPDLGQARDGAPAGIRLSGRDGVLRRGLQHGTAALPAGVHPARRGGDGRRIPRQRGTDGLGCRRLPVHHRAVHCGLLPDGGAARGGAAGRPAAVRMVRERRETWIRY